MHGTLWAVGAAIVIFAGVISYAMTRRYGWGAAIALPVLALVTVIGLQWQDQGLGVGEGMRLAGSTLVISGPVLMGVLIGAALARLRRK